MSSIYGGRNITHLSLLVVGVSTEETTLEIMLAEGTDSFLILPGSSAIYLFASLKQV